jgi:nucleoid DNA-binding protein
MTRTQLLMTLAHKTGVHPDDVKKVVDALFDDVIPTEVEAGRSVAVRGFGTFEARFRQARLVRHPETKELMHIPARYALVLRPAKGRG